MLILDEFESKRLLNEWGLPVIEEVLLDRDAEALKAAAALTYPVALKVCSRDVPHKTERGGVKLGIADAASLKAEVRAMRARFAAVPHKLLVQRMAPDGLELILGARRDPVFGPVVMAGMGGVFAEILRDTAIELAPLTPRQTLDMLGRLKGQALLQGYRGIGPVDLSIVAEAIVSLGRLMTGRPDIIEIDVNPLIAYPRGALAVDALIRFADRKAPVKARRPAARTVDPFFHPRSLALIGASRSHGKGGNIILRNLMRAGFQGALYPINPSGHDILGMRSYQRVSEVPGPVDLAMIVIPKTAVAEALADCAAKGVPAVILSTGGYADIGETGAREQAALMSLARKASIRVMGPNSIGTIHPRLGLATSIVGLEPIATGGVSLIGQSGVFSSGWGRWIADAKPFGISKVACIGNKGDINESDLLEYLAQDRETTVIGMYLEGVVEGARFIRAASKASRSKPVVVVKSGHTAAGAAAIASHTGSLAGSDAVFDAVCRRTGLVRVHDSEAFFDTLSAFESLPLPKSNRLGVLSITGMG
ncbi:MAG TPA: acetate--CoA ligase family protein, partial [Deltaproteobacteria bacterium]|nr:acetate--CoA ligase family protein [Deltaproteobacteria bacterium]